MKSLAAEVPLNDDVARAAIYVVNHHSLPVQIDHGLNTIVAGMKTATATAYSKSSGRIGEPVVVEGKAIDGAKFSTAKWRGKVVIVDFWATWCPPCRNAMPGVIERYNKYHDHGLEILGVSSDSVKKDLTSYLSQHLDIVWPQLFTPNDFGGWHPLTAKFNVEGIPTAFLIDRKGILRERENGRPLNEDMIVKVLAETDAAPKPVPAPPAPVLAAPAPTTPAAKTPEPPVVPTKAEGGGL
jgi:thiol-disulfide isomerase/thioredoxin